MIAPTDAEQFVNNFVLEMKYLNNRISEQGQLPQTEIIKRYHHWTNFEWYGFFTIANYLNLNHKAQRQIDQLLAHIEDNHVHHHNLLFPTEADRRNMPHALTHLARDTSVKSVTWNTMMLVREQYCREIVGFDIPNHDSSIGMLAPQPKDSLFDYGS